MRAPRLSADERRDAIVAAVLPLLVSQGPQVTTKQIAEAAGVAEGTIFRVFPDKKALLFAAAKEAIDPKGGGEALAGLMAQTPELADKLRLVVDRLVARMEQGMTVILALRHAAMTEPHQHDPQESAERRGPPEFIRESNRALLRHLAEDVFAPHADQLRVSPDRAALALRSLVFGTWHPGVIDERLTTDEIADLLLVGLTRPEGTP